MADDRKYFEREIAAFNDTGGDETFSIPLAEAIDQLKEAMNEIPEALRNTALFQINGYGDYCSVYPKIVYTEPETDVEMQERHAQIEIEKKRYKERHERDERAAYERLKKKYEG